MFDGDVCESLIKLALSSRLCFDEVVIGESLGASLR